MSIDEQNADILESIPTSPDVIKWALRLAAHPYFTTMIVTNPLLMGAWHKVVHGQVTWPAELKSRLKDGSSSTYSLSHSFLELTGMLESRFGAKIAGDYTKAYSEGFNISSHYMKDPIQLSSKLKKDLAKIKGSSRIGHVDEFVEVLELNKEEELLLNLSISQELYPYFKIFLELLMEIPENARQAWSVLLSPLSNKTLNSSETINTVSKLKEGKLQSLGVLDFKSITKPPAISDQAFLMLIDTRTDLLSVLVEPLSDKFENAESVPRVNDTELEMARKLFNSNKTNNKNGIPLMIWGPKSVDKLYVANQVVKKRPAWVIASSFDKTKIIPLHVVLAQRLIHVKDRKACLVVPDASSVLSKGSVDINFFGITLKDEVDEHLNNAEILMLKQSPTDTLWIANNIKRINQMAAAECFYHLEVKTGSRVERLKKIDDILEQLKLTERTKKEIAKFNNLTELQLKKALAGAELIDTSKKEAFILSAIYASARALDIKSKEQLRIPVTKYSLDFINTSGRMPPDKLLTALARNPNSSLCLFGLPGTGKTQFAEHIATVLEKPIIMKRGSDLLDKYVGETEKHIAAMFEEAEDESAILFLDEADSFLRSRTMSKESWEVTRVNELLQKMERFSGIFICATNLFEHLDSAALRRFTFKLEFLPLNERQRVKMFLNETEMDTRDPILLEKVTEELVMMRNLTPGDFATVKRQANTLGETLSIDDWLARLKTEVDIKSREMAVTD